MRRCVFGLDLSLTQTGVCYLPGDWNGERSKVLTYSIKSKKDKLTFGNDLLIARAEMERYHKIIYGVIDVIKDCSQQLAADPKNSKDVSIACESYAFGAFKNSSSVTHLTELGGIVKSQILMVFDIPVVSVAASSARKTLMGKLERKDQKDQVRTFLSKQKFFFDTDDEMDAFVIAHHWFCKVNGFRGAFAKQGDLFGV